MADEAVPKQVYEANAAQAQADGKRRLARWYEANAIWAEDPAAMLDMNPDNPIREKA